MDATPELIFGFRLVFPLGLGFEVPALAMPNELDHVVKVWWRVTSLQDRREAGA